MMTRLHLFTGKGGVGKTTLSLAYAQKLQAEGKQVHFYNFGAGKIQPSHSLHHHSLSQQYCDEHHIPCHELNLKECTTEYMADKLKSETVAKWIAATPFFKALFNMIPGINYLIFLGKILQDLEKNPLQVAVVDAPATGHFLTLLEATFNFRNIFQSGIIFSDTCKMINLLEQPHYTLIHIVSAPTQMSLTETIEFRQKIMGMAQTSPVIILNSCLSQVDLAESNAPYLNTKLKKEEDLISQYKDDIDSYLPFCHLIDDKQCISSLASEIQ